MGIYATTTSLQTLMIGTEFDTGTSSLATLLLQHAENEVEKYLSKRYDLAVFSSAGSVPPLVKSITETLAEGYMYQRMSRGGKESMERGQKLIDQALANLKDIAEYRVHLTDENNEVIPDMSNTAYRVLCSTDDYAPTFNEDNELDWKVDPDKIDDISSERD